MIRSAFFLVIVVFRYGLQAQDRGTKDIVSLSGRYGLAQEYKNTHEGTATETGMLNSLSAGLLRARYQYLSRFITGSVRDWMWALSILG